MKILRISVIFLMLTVLLVGCRGAGPATPDYRASPFRAEVRWESGGISTYAELETAWENGALVLSSVRLLAPPSLEGITLRCENGEIVLVRDGLDMTAAGAARWWETASLVCAAGTLSYVCDTEWQGLALEYAEIADGEGVVEVLRERTTGTPVRIACGERVLTVIRFEAIGARG